MQDQKKQPNTVSEEDEVSSSSKEEMSATEVAQALRQDPNIFYIDLKKKPDKKRIRNGKTPQKLHNRGTRKYPKKKNYRNCRCQQHGCQLTTPYGVTQQRNGSKKTF